ncbi:MAG: hypothetical protein ACYCYI_02480 [Saccharofermentanales bacterium]
MKKLLVLFLSFNMLLTSFTPQTAYMKDGQPPELPDGILDVNYTRADLEKVSSEQVYDDDFLPATAKWLDVIGNEKPATFSSDKITCVLADNVVKVNKTVTDSIADMGQVLSGSAVQKMAPNRIVEKGGYISKNVLDAASTKKIENGSVVVDESTGTAFKVVSPTVFSGIFDGDPELSKMVKPLENTYALIKPELHEVVKMFELAEETITLNKANITHFAANVESSMKPISSARFLAVGDEDKMFKYLKGDNLIDLDFEDTPLKGKVGNSTINVKLSGGIAIDGVNLTGRYSGMGGYEISMTLQQECYIIAELDAEIHEEIKIPILGIDIPFGIGEIYGGIFAVIGMDGTVRLGIEARETNSCKMGIEGGTFLYVPTSFHPIFEPTPPIITGDCEMNGKINGYIKVGPMLGLELFGFDLVGAGVLLGAGVNVQSDGSMLDIELYASIDVYVALAGKKFNLVRARPTIYKKQQPDLYGYKVSFLETYVNPGRVGGLIEQEPSDAGGAYIPAVNLQYRIWIVPKNSTGSFKAANRESILTADKANANKPLKEKVRTYPEGAFARTNGEGEFFEENDEICFAGDDVYLEFIGITDTVGKTIFVGPATPVLPFTDVTITYSDYFNDFITGKVEPKRLIDWDKNRLNPDEIQTELTYYKGPITISPFNDYGFEPGSYGPHAKHLPYTISGEAQTQTNEKGEFDTRNPFIEAGIGYPAGTIDVLEQNPGQCFYYDKNGEKQYFPVYSPNKIGVIASLKINNAVNNTINYGIIPASPDFQITRTLDFIENSYKKFNEGDKIINQMSYDEYLWIANPAGTRTITADMLTFNMKGFSTQDYKGYYENPVKETREGPITITPVLNVDGDPTGTALFAQRITVQWVWQEHPDPIKITSADHTQAVSGGESSFQVKADGFLPRYSLEGEPQRVWIDEKTGLLYIPQTLTPGIYKFTIHVKEGIAVTSPTLPDPKKGNDASPPVKQYFTLTVTAATSGLSSPASSAASSANASSESSGIQSSSASSNPVVKTAPVIFSDEYNTYFNMDGSVDLTVPFKASGSAPITWSLTAVKGHTLSAGISINSVTGVVTVTKSLAAGVHYFAVKASNDAGSDLHECTVVMAARTAPVLESRRDGYRFKMSAAKTDFSVSIKASGSIPIRYTLEALNERLPVPPEMTIDSSTGVLKVKGGVIGGIKAGVYDFNIKASNDIGSDIQACKLEVTAALLPSLNPVIPKLSDQSSGGPDAIQLAVSAKPGSSQNYPSIILDRNMFSKDPPPNKITLRCDDLMDVYTNDRYILNGAHFICWDTRVVITVMKVFESVSYELGNDGKPYVKLIPLGAELVIQDNSPACDNYHYYHPDDLSPTMPLTEEQIAEIKKNFKKAIDEKMSEYKNGYLAIGQDFSAKGMLDYYLGLKTNPMEREISTLEYGSLLKEINAQKSGIFNVDLNKDTGTVITGEYFMGLKSNPKASITFKQGGAEITFAGKDIEKADADEMINIGFTSAPHETDMLESVGSGFENFAYGFQHHGELPGMAEFAVSTTLKEGTKVNVYKYDIDAGKFIPIAKGAIVGAKGVVTYQNNTMSEYLITTKNMSGAALMNVTGSIANLPGIVIWVIIILLSVITIGAAVWLIIRKRRHVILQEDYK